jgi:hypothetical protein
LTENSVEAESAAHTAGINRLIPEVWLCTAGINPAARKRVRLCTAGINPAARKRVHYFCDEL